MCGTGGLVGVCGVCATAEAYSLLLVLVLLSGGDVGIGAYAEKLVLYSGDVFVGFFSESLCVGVEGDDCPFSESFRVGVGDSKARVNSHVILPNLGYLTVSTLS